MTRPRVLIQRYGGKVTLAEQIVRFSHRTAHILSRFAGRAPCCSPSRAVKMK